MKVFFVGNYICQIGLLRILRQFGGCVSKGIQIITIHNAECGMRNILNINISPGAQNWMYQDALKQAFTNFGVKHRLTNLFNKLYIIYYISNNITNIHETKVSKLSEN